MWLRMSSPGFNSRCSRFCSVWRVCCFGSGRNRCINYVRNFLGECRPACNRSDVRFDRSNRRLMVVAAGMASVLTAGGWFDCIRVAAALVGAALLRAQALRCGECTSIVAEYWLQASVAIGALGAAMPVFGAGTIVAGAGCTVLAVGLLAVGVAVLGVTVGVVAFGVAMTAACVGVLAMAAALLAVNFSMKSIAKNAKTAQKSIEST